MATIEQYVTVLVMGEDKFAVVFVRGDSYTGGLLPHFKTADDAILAGRKEADRQGVEFLETETA